MLKRFLPTNNAANMSLVFTGLMFLLPFVNMHHQLPITSFYSEWIAGVLGLAAITPILCTAKYSTIRIPQISLVFIGLTVILGLQWTMGMLQSTQYTLLMLSYLVWAFLLAVIGSYLRQEFGWERLATTLAWFLLIAGIINASIVMLQIVVRTGGTITFLPFLTDYGTISQANHFADFITLSAISLIYLYIKGRFSPGFFTLILIWLLQILTFSGSRSAWLYLIAITTLSFILHKATFKQHKETSTSRHLLHISMLVLPTFAVVQLFTYYVIPNDLVNSIIQRIADATTTDTPSARLHIWYDSLRLFMQSPWLGIGAGAMRLESFQLLDMPTAMAYKGIFEHAHNVFLHLLVEMGIGAFFIALIGLIAWVRAFKWQELNLETWWAIALLTVLGIHSMLEYPLWYAYFLGIAALLLGASDEKFASINLRKLSTPLSAKLACSGLTAILLVGAVNLSTMLVANVKLENSLQQLKNTDLYKEKELDWVRRYTLLSQYVVLMNAISMVVDRNDIDNQFLLNQSAMAFMPLRKIAYQHALLLKLKGDQINAKNQLKRTLIVYPYDVKYLEQYVPSQYRKDFLDILSEANPVLSTEIVVN